MEPEVHIIEKYFQEILRCFTMANIRCKNKKEIDLLAVNPQSGDKYHVEARISTSRAFALRSKDPLERKHSYKRGLDYFIKEKFNHPAVVKKIKELFGNDSYSKVLVVFHVDTRRFDAWDADEVGVKIWFITDLIETLMQQQNARGCRDEILRTLELMRMKRIYDAEIQRREEIAKRNFLSLACKTCHHFNKIKVTTNYVRYSPEPHSTILLPIYEAIKTSKCEKCRSIIAESKHRFILDQQVSTEWVKEYAKRTQSNVFKLRLIESRMPRRTDFDTQRSEFWTEYLYGSGTKEL